MESRESSCSVSCWVKAIHQSSKLDSMGEPARGMDSRSMLAGRWRADTSSRGGGGGGGGCWESKAMDKTGQASAAGSCSR